MLTDYCFVLFIYSLCVVLVTDNSPVHDPYRETFRSYARTKLNLNERVQYTYIYADSQAHFVNRFSSGQGNLDTSDQENGTLKVQIMKMYQIYRHS